MSKSEELRITREGTVINELSKIQEKKCIDIVLLLEKEIQKGYRYNFVLKKRLKLSEVVDKLKKNNPNKTYTITTTTSYIQPDGGILYIIDKNGNEYPILITEVKTQGTNQKRLEEGKAEQSKGNAIERLGKNVIVIEEYMSNESINPFVCFGEGCDFEEGSTILDRVAAIARFQPLNQINLYSNGSYFFKADKWAMEDMFDIMYNIAVSSIDYYKNKYPDNF